MYKYKTREYYNAHGVGFKNITPRRLCVCACCENVSFSVFSPLFIFFSVRRRHTSTRSGRPTRCALMRSVQATSRVRAISSATRLLCPPNSSNRYTNMYNMCRRATVKTIKLRSSRSHGHPSAGRRRNNRCAHVRAIGAAGGGGKG